MENKINTEMTSSGSKLCRRQYSDSESEQFPHKSADCDCYEVERIISRTMNADGTYVYHIKWLGYETSLDPENIVEEQHMMCPELIREFEVLERIKRKKRLKKPRDRIKQRREAKLRTRKLVRAMPVHLMRKTATYVLQYLYTSRQCHTVSCFQRSTSIRTVFRSLCAHFFMSLLFKRDDPYSDFKYVSRESDGFRKGYKTVKVNVLTEHPTTGEVVGVVVFSYPRDGKEFAQYIPLREIHDNAP
ncbi:hypothetical protein Angca_001945, partial [Angiostrongylus cantonensis]